MPIPDTILIFATGSLFGFFVTTRYWHRSNRKVEAAIARHKATTMRVASRGSFSNQSTNPTER